LRLLPSKHQPARAGFTLAEVAVTLVIVGLGLVVLLQGLNTAKMTAAYTRNLKLASELARLTLGRVAAGLFQDELGQDSYLDGTYADEGYPEFSWELLLGDETFGDPSDDRDRFDSFDWDAEQEEEDEEEEVEEPYDKVKVRVSFPAMRAFADGETTANLVLEEWIPWKQVYGEDEE
jgi:prepilin-type N-terminal cleavage/methylation domain-containing protein